MNTSEIIQPHHLSRQALIYVRQLSPGQVLNHRESLDLQYALRERPCQSGWDPGSIAVIDTDLGLTGNPFDSHKGCRSKSRADKSFAALRLCEAAAPTDESVAIAPP